MARRSSGKTGAASRLRGAIVERRRRHLEAWGSDETRVAFRGFEAAVLSGAEIELDTDSLFRALFLVDEVAARRFAYRSDPGNQRRFLLTERDELVEIPSR